MRQLQPRSAGRVFTLSEDAVLFDLLSTKRLDHASKRVRAKYAGSNTSDHADSRWNSITFNFLIATGSAWLKGNEDWIKSSQGSKSTLKVRGMENKYYSTRLREIGHPRWSQWINGHVCRAAYYCWIEEMFYILIAKSRFCFFYKCGNRTELDSLTMDLSVENGKLYPVQSRFFFVFIFIRKLRGSTYI